MRSRPGCRLVLPAATAVGLILSISLDFGADAAPIRCNQRGEYGGRAVYAGPIRLPPAGFAAAAAPAGAGSGRRRL